MRAVGLSFAYAPVSRMTGLDLDALWTVYSSFFDTERSSFDEAVRRADEVVRYRDPADGRLCGMALLSARAASHEGRAFRVLSTSAVCLEPAYRGLNAVQRLGLSRLARERVRHPFSNVYWYFDTFSYRSYLLLPRNVIELLARRHGGEAWSKTTGIIGPQGRRLRPGVADVPPDDPDPEVRYFLDRNPGYAAGDRLPCLCPLNARNVAAIAWRAIHRGARGGTSGMMRR